MRQKKDLAAGLRCESNREPLHKRLPGVDASGERPTDFMMLIPGLRNLAPALLDARLKLLQNLLQRHGGVLFVDLNLPLNLLWVSVSQRNGVINELSADIRRAIPEARLVGHPGLPLSAPRPRDRRPAALGKPRFARLLRRWR